MCGDSRKVRLHNVNHYIQNSRNFQKKNRNLVSCTSTLCVLNTYKLLRNYLKWFKRSCTYWKKNRNWRTGWLTDGRVKTSYPSQLFAWGTMKDVLWFLSKEKCTATHAENRLCEHKAILKRKILRIETLRTALQTLLVTITNIQ